MANVVQKKNKGRQKVKMERMEKDSNRQVTFSKRRSGLFKKASELCTLCGAEAAIIVFSPGKKAFSFGHPCVETVLNRYLFAGPKGASAGNEQIVDGHQSLNVHDLNMELTIMNSRIEAEKKRSEELTQVRKARAEHFWWDVPVEELNPQQLQHLKASLEELKQHVYQHGNKLMMEASNNVNVNVNANHFMGITNPMVGFNHNPALFNPTLGFGYQQDYNY
ncbi:hypothetical protein RND81_09G158800 [Saponaria officinalis]|uniref:MADS-box domain-containing protein n=1 Tax=Saponaria officinalis TaxID=3572 RepID=A0AAW1IMM1_SAPOF